MNWTWIKTGIKYLAQAGLDQGYITQKAYDQIIAALGKRARMSKAVRKQK